MTFGPFEVSSPLETKRVIASTIEAAAYIKTVPHRHEPWWRISERMVELAWMSDLDHRAAEFAFRHAIKAEQARSWGDE